MTQLRPQLRPQLDWTPKGLAGGVPGTRHVVAYPAVLADEEVDPGLIGSRRRDLIAQIGAHLTAQPRDERPVTV